MGGVLSGPICPKFTMLNEGDCMCNRGSVFRFVYHSIQFNFIHLEIGLVGLFNMHSSSKF